MNLNKAMIIGYLTRDPEVRTTSTGQTVASFGVATNFVWKDSQTGEQKKITEFHNVTTWRRLAEICGQYLRKGSKVYMEGRLQTRDWIGQDGVKRYRTEIIADNMIMLDRPGTTSAAPTEQPPTPTEQPSAPSEPVINVEEPTTEGDEGINPSEEEIKVESIPF